MIPDQFFTPVVIGEIYALRQRPVESGLAVKYTNENITHHFIASLPELAPN